LTQFANAGAEDARAEDARAEDARAEDARAEDARAEDPRVQDDGAPTAPEGRLIIAQRFIAGDTCHRAIQSRRDD